MGAAMRTMRVHSWRVGFTLIELLVVVAIMAMMGTASVGAYRSMRRGMEERAVENTASQFIRTAYQRAMIERTPVCVYFWNELIAEETDTTPMKVSGRAVAVRRIGRISGIHRGRLVDEFGNLENYKLVDSSGNKVQKTGSSRDAGIYLYRVNGGETEFRRSTVLGYTDEATASCKLLSDVEDDGSSGLNSASSGGNSWELNPYCFTVIDKGGIDWQIGDAYGLEFAEIQLPNGYIWESNYPKDKSKTIEPIKVMNFNPLNPSNSGANETIAIHAVRPDASGEMALDASFSETTVAPSQQQSQQD